jgi:alkanesulfonate monooxygenase SsuD/methylene tetrahydromethanopterin reductase-like flavin-dependent oxidoreductase (luciferase family)
MALDENWAVTHEIMDILEMGIETGHVEYQGKHFQIPSTPIGVPVLQRPSPPVIVAGNQPDYLRRAARKGYRPIITVGPQPVAAQLAVREHVSKHYQMEGIGDDALPLAISRAIYVTDDKQEALEAAERTLYTARLVMAFRGRYEKLNGVEVELQPFEGEPSLEQIVENLPIGDPETVAEKIVAEVRASRPWHYALFAQYGGLDGKRSLRSLERFGAEVLPLIDKALGGIAAFGPKVAQRAAAE